MPDPHRYVRFVGLGLASTGAALASWGAARAWADPLATPLWLPFSGLAIWVVGLFLAMRSTGGDGANRLGNSRRAVSAEGPEVAESAPIGYFFADANGVIVRANDALHRVLGRAAGSVVGYSVAELGIESAAGAEAGGAIDYQHPDGGRRALDVTRIAPTDPTDASVGHHGWVTDVSDLNRLRVELDDASARLRQHGRLEQLGSLAAGLAHDLNNLLAPIVGHVDLAQLELPADSPVQADLEVVMTAARRAGDLTRCLLGVARAERDDVAPVAIQEIIQEVVALLNPAPRSAIEIETRVESGCPAVLGTKTALHQVLFNLSKNALHAMPAGGTLTLTLGEVEPLATWVVRPRGEGPFVRLEVRDTGIGMDEATLGQIFDPLFTLKPAGEGSGLGLSMVKSIVKDFGGTITVKSAAGQGSTFTVLFPAHAQSRRTEVLLSAASVVSESHGHVLVVDDDEAVLSVYSRSLSRLGYRVTSFISSNDALEALLERPEAFDLLLTDQMMPTLTGLELLKRVRSARPDLPAVLTTGRVDLVPREELDRLECELLPKPASTTELGEVVARGMSRFEHV